MAEEARNNSTNATNSIAVFSEKAVYDRDVNDSSADFARTSFFAGAVHASTSVPDGEKGKRKEMKMKRISAMLVVMGLSLSSLTFAAEEKEVTKEQLKTPSETLSYALGMEIGASLKTLETEIDFAAFIRGVEAALKGTKSLLTPQEANNIRQEFFRKRKEELARKRSKLADKNRKEGEAFLTENKKKKGVETTASGLQYTVLREGDGPKPAKTDRVKVHYRGTFLDGTEFDSSYEKGQPASFPVTGVIRGWTEALQLMRVGSKYRLFIPSDLAYGERGAGARIGPNATLIFEVELLDIEK